LLPWCNQSITFEVADNFQKQTNRNRAYIYSPNGIQLLNIPIKHSKESHPKRKILKLKRILIGKTTLQITGSSL
jgi:hypothetical protein